jgi:ketosteroid isomerase-like protein
MGAMKPTGAFARAVALAIVLAGCSGAATKEVEEPEAVDSSVAAQGARELVKEIYASLRRGSTGGLLPLLDPTFVAIGPGPGDMFTERSEALVALGVAVPEGKHKVVSTDLRVAASPEGHAAWATDVVQIDGKPFAIGVIMLESDELWTVTAIQIGIPNPKKGKGAAPDPVAPTAFVAPPVGGNDKALAERFAAGLTPADLQDQMDATTVVRDLTGKASSGPKAIKKAWKKAMKNVSFAPRKDLHARLAPDGSAGWVFGVVDVTNGTAPPVPTRYLHVYANTPDGWRLALAAPVVAR